MTIELKERIVENGFNNESPSSFGDKQIYPSVEAGTNHESITDSIFNLVLHDWMLGFGNIYQAKHFHLLRKQIERAVRTSSKLTFLLPGFPAKSPSVLSQVISLRADYTEYAVISLLQKTLRKLEAIHKPGVELAVLSDYHTFDAYLGVTEQDYLAYQASLQAVIDEEKCSDVIRLIPLSDFPEFKGLPSDVISKKLMEDYGGKQTADKFRVCTAADPILRDKYNRITRILAHDQDVRSAGCLPSSPQRSPQLPKKLACALTGSHQTVQVAASTSVMPTPSQLSRSLPGLQANREAIQNNARDMLLQDKCLDAFLQLQTKLAECIRLSLYYHPPSSGKFAVDLFREHEKTFGVLKPAWHRSMVFDTESAIFTVAHREEIETEVVENSCLISVTYKDQDWFFLRLYFNEDFLVQMNTQASIQATMMRGGFGIILTLIHGPGIQPLLAQAIPAGSLTALTEEFGVVVLRGFHGFQTPDEVSRNREESQLRIAVLEKCEWFERIYEELDMVYVNSTTLHRRNGFSDTSELWRLPNMPISNDNRDESGKQG